MFILSTIKHAFRERHRRIKSHATQKFNIDVDLFDWLVIKWEELAKCWNRVTYELEAENESFESIAGSQFILHNIDNQYL